MFGIMAKQELAAALAENALLKERTEVLEAELIATWERLPLLETQQQQLITRQTLLDGAPEALTRMEEANLTIRAGMQRILLSGPVRGD